MKNIFYCPKCNTEEENYKFETPKQERELTTWVNPRDGYGRHIRHTICPTCGNVLAGVMDVVGFQEDDIWYAKTTIDKYNKESKDGGYIADGKLEWLINDIKSKKGIDKMKRGKRALVNGIVDESADLNEGLVTTYEGKRITLEEYQNLCKELNINELSESE